mmetsp:Transcript_41730/g.83728  ORF Transcript_41730/g.83728 Transcript_41730/m.83728 type:complete len:136 (+) Transcript_41730:271-678(+)
MTNVTFTLRFRSSVFTFFGSLYYAILSGFHIEGNGIHRNRIATLLCTANYRRCWICAGSVQGCCCRAGDARRCCFRTLDIASIDEGDAAAVARELRYRSTHFLEGMLSALPNGFRYYMPAFCYGSSTLKEFLTLD